MSRIKKTGIEVDVQMEMTIKQLASELGVSKPTVRSVITELGFHDKLRKVGNRYMLSDMQISEIKLKMSNKSENELPSSLSESRYPADRCSGDRS